MKLLKKTTLNRMHHDLKARMMDFAGWDLPVWYTSILEEHKAVRSAAGIFDVSDMGRVWVTGVKAGDFLDRVLTKPVQRLAVGTAQLCLLCLENGSILDDLWVYRVGNDRYLIVWNEPFMRNKPDFFCLDKTTRELVIVENKVRGRHKRIETQLLSYKAWVNRNINKINVQYKDEGLKATTNFKFVIITDTTDERLEAICEDSKITLILIDGGVIFEEIVPYFE